MAALPRMSVRLHGGMPADDCIALTVCAEESGFDGVWFAENLFGRGILPVLGACAHLTSRVAIGIGVFNPFNRHPTLIAMEAAALDEIAMGRVVLGLGSGVKGLIEQAGISHEKPLGGLRDTFQIVRAMIAGEMTSHTGRVFSVQNVKLGFTPLRKEIPLYMAAMGDQALKTAGEIADGVLISNMSPPGYTARVRSLIAAGASNNRRPVSNIVQYVSCVCSDNGNEAREILAASISELLARYWNLKDRTPLIGEAMMKDSGIPQEDFAAAVARLAAGEKPVSVLDQRFLDTYGICGTPEECLAAISRFTDVGVTELVLTFTGRSAADDMRRLGRAIMHARGI